MAVTRYPDRPLTPLKWLACVVLGLCSAAMLSQPGWAQEKTFFRIVNDAGVVELKSTITPEEAKRGYSIVTLGGHVIKEVLPELSDEEFAELSEEIKKQRLEEDRQKKEQAYNYSLLLRYSSINDLEAERQRKLREFDVRISILRSNLHGLKEKAIVQQALAADIERKGNTVPEHLTKNINEIESEMKEAEASILSRQQEKQLIDEQYNADAERLQSLLTQRAS